MKVGIIIGRFQPFHEGHGDIFKRAAKESDVVVFVIGSSNRCRSVKNPFSFDERASMIRLYAEHNYIRNDLYFVESHDNLPKEWTWKSDIKKSVSDLFKEVKNVSYSLYGHFKDSSSYYLNEFPEWELVSVDQERPIDATDIRKAYFHPENHDWKNTNGIPQSTFRFLNQFELTDEYGLLLDDQKFFDEEKIKFADYPFLDTLNFICADAVVVCMGYILLIKRKHSPGKGAWALPGGFKNNNETLLQTCLRELKEETNIRVPYKVLEGSVKGQHMFDHPRRSTGIQRISMAYYIDLEINYDGSLPAIRPASDAYEARWIPLNEALGMNLFEDHSDIIRWFI